MFVIELVYTASLDEIDAHMTAHMKFLKKYYASGHFVVSGRKIPRDGGIILAVGKSREEVEAIAREDPFCRHGLAEIRVVEFRASQRADDIPHAFRTEARDVIPLFLIAALSAGAPAPTIQQVLTRAGAYVTAFEERLSGIVAEEQYVQEDRYPRGYPLVLNTKRRLLSDLLLVKPIGASDWMTFRDVYEVDGTAVRDREARLAKLFLNPPSSVSRQVSAILDESARYNIGSVLRTINAPLLSLIFLEPRNQNRFKFKRTRDTTPHAMTTEAPAPPGHFRLATEVWAIEYEERSPDTMIRTTNMRDLPARGRFWIEPESGRVLMTELVLESRAIRGTINVNYQSNPLLGLLVPVEMRERYDKLRDRSVVEGFASYGRFREFQVLVDEKLAPIRKPPPDR
jgi:uncharacterized protein YciI